ncbi:MAG: hypothetical protein ACTH1D_09435 [Mycobacteriaceae bacterium]|uniref:hypothetical protein n=1 Tax=Corynebacterium sp. TaxID=1720 RepID=UPI003F989BF2
MTDFKKWRLALIAGLAVPALALSACSSDDSDSDADSDSSADAGGSEDSEGSGDSDDSDDSGDSADVELEGAPDGFELTDPGSKLSLGDDAFVVTQGYAEEGQTGALQFWKVTAQDSTDVPVEEVELSSEADEVENFVCMNYDIEFLGAQESDDPEASTSIEDPDLGAVDDDGNGANTVIMSDSSDCGIHASDEMPYDLDELQEGKVYKAAALSYVTNDGSGVDPTGMDFEFDVDAPGLENADAIYWN